MPGRIILPALAAVALTVAACGGHKRVAPPSDAPATGTPIVSRSADSDAPANAPAHWLPPEAWVYNHWLPYDETRLYRLLAITRVGLWEQLRDDHRTLAQLAARHGWQDPRRIAAARTAPGAGRGGAPPGTAGRTRAGSPPRPRRRRRPASAPRAQGSSGSARCGRSPRATSPSTCSSTRCTSSASRAKRRRSSA